MAWDEEDESWEISKKLFDISGAFCIWCGNSVPEGFECQTCKDIFSGADTSTS